MKKIYFLILIFLVTVFTAPGLLAQVPNGFNYQAVARDVATGDPIQNAALSVRIAILSSVGPDVVVWEEEHSLTSNEFGIFTLQVGDASATYVDGSAGSFAEIDWTSGTYYIRPSVKQSGGNWQLMSASKLIAVPFAMLAKDVENKQALTQSGDILYLSDGGSADLSGYVNPSQTISKSGNILTLNGGGGTVNLGEYVNQFDADADTLSKLSGSLVLGSDQANGSVLKVVGTELDPEAPLFEVKNRDGQQVFAVYENGVQIHVDDISTTKKSRGGFAVAGFENDLKAPGDAQNFLVVTPDSVRMFIPETVAAKDKGPGSRGGFAVGGFESDGKAGLETLYFNVSGQNDIDIIEDKAQMLWYPRKEAFQAGRINIPTPDSVGLNSTAFGFHPMAKGDYSQAFGNLAKATGDNSTAIGNQAEARGFDSYAFGSSALATGQKSFAMGSVGVDSIGNPMSNPTTASGDYSMALGMSSGATQQGALAVGVDSWSSGWYSTALGYRSLAQGSYSTALGLRARAVGSNSMALGMYSWANGLYSLSLGSRATSTGDYSVAVGYYAQSLGDYSAALGYYAQADNDYAYALGRWASAEGLYSYALGNSANATGMSAYSLGNSASAQGDYSYALGQSAYSGAAHTYALGYNAEATNTYAYALGYNSIAGGYSSYALGNGANATQSYSYAVGYASNATNSYAIAIGTSATASGQYGTAIGRAASASNTVSTAIGYNAEASGYGGTAIGLASKAIGNYSNALGWYAEAQKPYSVAIGLASIANGDYAFAIGRSAQSTANNATALGYGAQAQAVNAYAFGTDAISSGAASVTLGYKNTASVDSAIAIGNLNTSNGANAISFGNSNTSSGSYSVAIGTRSNATGAYSNSLGFTANATADRATAIGYEVSAQGYKSVSVGANYYKNFLVWTPPVIIFGKGDAELTKGPDGVEWGPGEGGEEPAGTKQFIILPTLIDRDNDAEDSYSVAIGGGNKSTNGGFTFGVYNDATEEFATAIGFANQSTGLYSTAIGMGNAAEGVNSTAMGRNTTAEAYNSFVVGTYNYLYSGYSKDTWVEGDPLFVIGNGTASAPNDAMVVDKNGYTYHEARDAYAAINAVNIISDRTYTSYGMRSYISASSTTSASTYSGYFASYNYGTGTNYGLWANIRTGASVDLAEYIYDNNRETEAADVVVADVNGKENAVKSTKAYQSSVIGIVSTKPHLLMGTELVMDEATGEEIEGVSAAKLALAGRVPCKVTDENGSIKPGDMLTTSSTPGHAMKWSLLDVSKAKDFEELKEMMAENEKRRNAVIGKALERHDAGTGKIIVLISLQ